MATPLIVPSLSHLRLAATEVAARHGLELVVLFGSAARADTPAPRDVDIGVRGPTLVDALALTNAFIASLQVQAIDLVDLRRADPVLLMLAARDGVALFEREPSSFAAFVSLAARRFADTKKFRDAEEAYIEDFLASRRGGR